MTYSTLPLRFVVLIEWRVHAALALLLTMAALLWPAPAHAAPRDKVAADLRQAMESADPPRHRWQQEQAGRRYVHALVVSDGRDPEQVELRRAVLAAGGTVYWRYRSVQALFVTLPVDKVDALALRPDVQGISPNRRAARTFSLMESSTGAADVRAAVIGAARGLDGTGIGVAVLDSGIAWSHAAFAGAQRSRVERAVDFAKATQGGADRSWQPGVDKSDAALNENQQAAAEHSLADPYGHGTHVAGIAAGRSTSRLPESNGLATNASLVDVKVLDGRGEGELSDVLAGIDWVIAHAKQHNIRVLNVSLAADSTESHLTDPLCQALRGAGAAGIVVVVAAGNYGKDAAGQERYGTITAPGNEPSVITVGSANTQATASRSDDAVNHFSSRGPTRGGLLMADGRRVADNLLKPDLVAPGNRIVGPMAASSTLATDFPSLSAPYGGTAQPRDRELMDLSGTSVAAPAVSGTVALMLQANPGLTPPLVKAILQYTAQALPGANLLQQGAGLLNVDGAVRLAGVLRADLAAAISSGRIVAGAPLLASGQ